MPQLLKRFFFFLKMVDWKQQYDKWKKYFLDEIVETTKILVFFSNRN